LNLASEADADFLITGDLDLLELKNYKRTKIVNWKYFISNVYGKVQNK
jgi:predicted nucleic acid-binding protein